MLRLIVAALLFSCSLAQAQVLSRPGISQAQLDATTATLNAAIAAVPVYTDSAAQAAVSPLIPLHCAAIPALDSLTGSVAAASCYTAAVDTRPTVTQAAVVTTDGTGAWSVTWAKAFQGASPFINAQPVNLAGTQPYICNVASSTSTTVSGKCWQTLTTTLPSVALSLLGLVVNPTGAAGSISVRVIGRDTTQ